MIPKMKTKFYYTLFVLVLTAGTAAAQYPRSGGASRGGGRQNMNMGHFYGKVVDGNTNKPLEAASVQLTRNVIDTVTKEHKSVIIAAMLTDKKGEFSIDKLPVFGKYQLIISAVGHTAFNEPISF